MKNAVKGGAGGLKVTRGVNQVDRTLWPEFLIPPPQDLKWNSPKATNWGNMKYRSLHSHLPGGLKLSVVHM